MDGSPLERLPRFTTVGLAEKINVCRTLSSPLSGYLGGVDKAGYFVTRLQERWCEAFGCKFAVACNSATSGLLASCMAIGIKPGDTVWTTAYSMSATAACAKVLGANIVFIDIETIRFSIDTSLLSGPTPKCIIVTNLFGHPAFLSNIRSWCDSNKVWMIEDNAQAPFAKEDGRYAGTVGHLGVFSLNVHKHIQCGEGGVVATDDPELNSSVLGAINHGELAGRSAGLNLRMTEPVAAIACSQLAKAPAIIEGRIDLAEEITDMIRGTFVKPPVVDTGCKHVYYYWAGRIHNGLRDSFINAMQTYNVPFRKGYSPPLHRVFGSNVTLPVVEQVEDEQIICFEICSWNPKRHHLNRMREIIKKVAGV
jgi:dTDP-4-amino-4,6-dideoxygalactose transaminase